MLPLKISMVFPLTSIALGLCDTVSLGSLATALRLLAKQKRQEQVFTEKEGLGLVSVCQPSASCVPLGMEFAQDFAITGCQWGIK